MIFTYGYLSFHAADKNETDSKDDETDDTNCYLEISVFESLGEVIVFEEIFEKLSVGK